MHYTYQPYTTRRGNSKRARRISVGDTYIYGRNGLKLVLAIVTTYSEHAVVKVTSLGDAGLESHMLTLEDLWVV